MKLGKFCTKEMRCTDLVRVKKANYKMKDEIKRRKIIRAVWKHHGDQAEEKEGVTYAPGSF